MKLQTNGNIATGTFVVDGLLKTHRDSLLFPDNLISFFYSLSPEDMETIGQPTCISSYVEDKGYGDEWYFKTPRGSTVAIGFRWGTPRLRGNPYTTTSDVIQFIEFLMDSLKKDNNSA